MALNKVRIKPGVNREGTQYSAGEQLTYWDGNKIRFKKGRPQKLGGWVKYGLTVRFPVDHASGTETADFRGIARSVFDWVTSTGFKHLGVGTNVKYYVEYGNFMFDITPLRATTSAGDVTFAATNGSSSLTVSDTAHGAVAGDYVTFSGALSLGGAIDADVLNHEYVIDSITDDDNYVITAREPDGTIVVANGSDTGDGDASVVGAYQINTGTNYYIPALGWGGGGWGSPPWGGGGTVEFSQQLRQWSQTEFGDDLVINPRGGGIYYWDQSADWSGASAGSGYATRAVNITDSSTFADTSDAPTVCLQVLLSPSDKHLIGFGTNPIGSSSLDPLFVRWADQESATVWTPTAINSAGGQVLSSGNFIIGATKTRQEILIFTDTSIHAMRFVGDPFVFQFAVISESVSSIAPNAAAAVGDAVFFMSDEGFYVYRGAVERLRCDLLQHVFDNVDKTQLFKVFAVHNPNDSEVWWFYPVGDNPAEITNYVIYNYSEDHWTPGTLERGAWTNALSRSNPIATSNDLVNLDTQYLYNHESGFDADGEEMGEYAESGLIELSGGEFGDGEHILFVKRLVPDFRYTGNTNNVDLQLTIKSTDFPQIAATSDYTADITATTQQIHTRVRARAVALRFDGAGLGYGWTMGDVRLDVRPDGRR